MYIQRRPVRWKTCARCGESKLYGAYHRDRAAVDGRRRCCKTCVKVYDDTLRDERNSRAREKYYTDPQSKIAATRAYHVSHPEWSRERLRAHHVANAVVRYQRYVERGLDPGIAQARRDACRRAESRRRAMKQGSDAEYVSAQDVRDLLAAHGNSCWICKREFSASLSYTLDHVHPIARGGFHMLSNLAPACGPCNQRKNARWPVTEELLDEIRTAVLVAADAADLKEVSNSCP